MRWRVSLGIMVVLSLAAGTGWANTQSITLRPGESQLTLTEQSRQELRFRIEVADLAAMEVVTREGTFTRLSIPGFHSSHIEGAPELPMMNRLIAIPYGAVASVEVTATSGRMIDLADYGIHSPLLPCQPSMPKNADPDTWPFVYDRRAYDVERVAQPVAAVAPLGRLRGMDLGRLEISPVEYFPRTNQIRVTDTIDLRVVFAGGDEAAGRELMARTYSPFFAPVYDQVANGRIFQDDYPDHVGDVVTMVIITPPEFEAQLQDFIDWKTERGFHMITGVIGTPEVGVTTTSIQAYVHDLYNNPPAGVPAPSFVLFVGDIAQCPTFTLSGDSSDRPYCAVDADLMPDMYYGRFSATNSTQLQAILDKTMMYDQFTMPDPSYLGEVVMIAGMDSGFGQVWANGQINYGTTCYFNATHGMYSHTYLYPQSGSMASQIVQDVSNGVAYVNYTAHGSTTSWSDPSFTQSNINSLQNAGKYCLAVGNCCLTSSYEVGECFAETWLRAPNKGAIGYIGGSNSTYWDEDYWWGVGYTASIVEHPTYETTGLGAYDGLFHDHGEAEHLWYVTNDALVFCGNLAVTEAGSSRIQYYWNIYNLMGDPSLSTYLGVPSANPVTHLPAVFNTALSLTVGAAQGSYVGLTQDGVLVGAGTVGESGSLEVEFLQAPLTPGVPLHMVVMAQNREPYVADINVIVPAGPFVIHQSHQIDDTQMGNGDGLLDYAEDVTLSMTLQNLGTDMAYDVQATISTGDTYVTLLDDTEAYGDIPAGGTATMTDAFALVAAEDIPDGHVVPFTVTVTDNDSTYTSYFSITAHAPDLALAGYDILDGENGVLDPGETADLEVTLHNAGSSAVNDLDLTLTSLGEFVTVTSGSAQIASVAPDGSETATFTVVADSETPIGQVAEFNLDVSATHYAYNTSFATTVGLSIEDFESGFFVSYPWEMSGNAPWLITSSGPYEGSYCAVSGDISDNQSSQMSVTFEVMAPGTISFYYKVSSESSYDYLHFYIDSNEQGSWSGTVGWTPASYPVSAGLHTFRWVYDKDGSVSTGSDCGWVDYIVFPAVGPQPFPSATCAPSSFEVTVAPQDSLMQAITLGNVGEADLNFSCSVVYDEKSEQTRVPTLNLKKDVEDRRDGEAPGRGSGGPDPYGYTWVDSDEPGGPTYQWVEINGVGTALQSADDANYGPFPLGFTFQYYGVNYTQIRICTNGFVSFTSTSTSYTNQGIPNSAQPNDMLAPFWDDLNTNYGGTIYYYADTANQRFIVEWDAVSHYSPSGTLETFEVILYADGRILYEYKTLSLGTSCSVGIEDAAGTTGLQVVYNAAYLHSDLSIVFRRPTPWVWVDPMSGTIAPQATAELGVEFNTMDVEIGDYSGTINLTTNDPEHPLMSIPVILHVRDDLSAVDESLPTVFALGSAHPNPFNPMTTIEFAVPQASRVQLRVYDLAGRLVRTLVNEEMTAGVHAVVWNGQDQGGRQVASGAYYYRLTAPGFSETEKMVLIK